MFLKMSNYEPIFVTSGHVHLLFCISPAQKVAPEGWQQMRTSLSVLELKKWRFADGGN